MATRFYCDGCDRSLNASERYEFAIAWEGKDVSRDGRKFDVCYTCLKMYIQAHNPITWPRIE